MPRCNHSFIFGGGGNPLELITRLILGYIVELFCHPNIKLDCFTFARNDVNKCHSDENQNLTMKQIELSNGEILKRRVGTENFVLHTQLIFQSVQDDRGKSICHSAQGILRVKTLRMTKREESHNNFPLKGRGLNLLMCVNEFTNLGEGLKVGQALPDNFEKVDLDYNIENKIKIVNNKNKGK